MEIKSVYLTGLFKYWNELARRYHTVFRVHPPHQSLSAADCSGHRADYGLIEHLYPPIVQSLFKVTHNIVFEGGSFHYSVIKPFKDR